MRKKSIGQIISFLLLLAVTTNCNYLYGASLNAPNLTLTTAGTTVQGCWNAVPNAAGYTLYYALYPEAPSIYSFDMGMELGFSFDLPLGSAFYVAIKAYNSKERSAYSNIEYFVLSLSKNGSKYVGINYAGNDITDIQNIQKDNLFGTLKMSGIWVSKLTANEYIAKSREFCSYASERMQKVFIQIPISFSNSEIKKILEDIKLNKCNPEGIVIGNEIDRISIEYTVEDYIFDYNRIVPIINNTFPSAKIVALGLSSFLTENYAENDSIEEKYQPVFNWLIPFCSANLEKTPDFVSVHYYPFTGAQKEWETLEAGNILENIFLDINPYLSNIPPIIIGEFNTTYQYSSDTVYPGSGGDSFMISLALPGILANSNIAALFHWSLVESFPSTLGLYADSTLLPSPVYYSYQMLNSVLERHLVKSQTNKPDITSYAYYQDQMFEIIIVNTSPFFRRDVLISGDSTSDIHIEHFKGCQGIPFSVTLPPFSINEIEGNLLHQDDMVFRRFSYADRDIRSGDFTVEEQSNAYCSTLVDFSEPNYEGAHFQNTTYDQNKKIATGGTYKILVSPGGKAEGVEGTDSLTIECNIPSSGYEYYQCGLKVPFASDKMDDNKLGKNWVEGLKTGVFRITLESNIDVPVEFHLETFEPENNTHRKIINVSSNNVATFEIPIAKFKQDEGWGVIRDISKILQNIAALRIEVRQPGFSGNLKIYKVELCDFY